MSENVANRSATPRFTSNTRPPKASADGVLVIDKYAPFGSEAIGRRRRLRTHYLVTAGLAVPGVARARRLRIQDGGLVLTLPWLPGVDLEAYIAQRVSAGASVALDPQQVGEIGMRLAAILVALETNGIAHGAIEPAHVLFEPESESVGLINFGAARFVMAQTVSHPDVPAITPAGDLHALGRLLFWLATGEHTVAGRDDGRRSAAFGWKPETISHLPEALIGIVVRLLDAGSPGGYRGAEAVVADLRAHLSGTGARLSGALGTPRALPLPAHRFGREEQHAALMDAYSDAIEGGIPVLHNEQREPRPGPEKGLGYPVLALIDGVSGIGKTAVILSACQAMRRHGARIAAGKFNQFGDSRPLWAIAQALDGIIAALLDEPAATRASAVQRLHEALGSTGGALFDFLPRLRQLIGAQAKPPAVSGEASRIRFELLLHRFVAALATRKAPLVIFLDDIHWADQASLDMMRSLLRNPSIRNLLLIGANRSEAVHPGHPLQKMIQVIVAGELDLRCITVNAWTRGDIACLMKQTGIRVDADGEELIGLLLESTAGAPFGVLQALREAHAGQVMRFDQDSGEWRVNAPLARQILGGVRPIELVGRRLGALAPECRDMLAAGALLGASFDLQALATASGRAFDESLPYLWPALVHGLVLPLEENAAPGSIVAFRSAHDIVQQAARLQIRDADLARRHTIVGRALLHYYNTTQTLDEHLFEIIQQFDQASSTVSEAAECKLLIELNVAAGRKARGSGAAVNALAHFLSALALLASRSPRESRQERFELVLETAETAYLAADFERLDTLLDDLANFRLDPVASARVQEVRIQGLLARNRLSEGLAVGEETLRALGVPLEPLTPPDQWPAIPQRSGLEMEPASNARIDTALRVLVWLTPCAYITSFEMYARVILTMVALARRFPASPLTPISYTNYGLTLCGVGHADEGFRAGELALALSREVGDEPLRCKVWTLAFGFLQHWKQPVAESLPPLLKTVEDCLLCGDQEYLGYASFLYCDKAWGIENLDGLERVHSRHTRLVEQFGHDFSWRHCLVWLQTLRTLRGNAREVLTLRGEAFDERSDILRLEKANNSFSLFTAHTLMALLAWHRADLKEALSECQIAANYAMTGGATMMAVEHRMLWAMAEIAGLSSVDSSRPSEESRRIEQMIRQLRDWASLAPHNFAHKLSLVEAEYARACGDHGRAWAFFETAGEQAALAASLHDRGLIAERAGDYYASQGLPGIARERLFAAYEHYMDWGATAVAGNLLQRYARLLAPADSASASAGQAGVRLTLNDKIEAALYELTADRLVVLLERLPTILVAERRPEGPPNIVQVPLDAASEVGPSRALLEAVSRRGEAVDLTQAERPAWVMEARDPGRCAGTALCLPVTQLGTGIGAVYIEAAGRVLPRYFLMSRLARHLQGMVDELRVSHFSRQLEASALIDMQTGLPNRTALIGMIDLALARRRGDGNLNTLVVVLRIRGAIDAIIDGVDRSPVILAEASRRLSTYGRGIATVARLDRLSFGLLIDGWPADRIQANIRLLMQCIEQAHLADLPFDISVDAGIRVDDGLAQAASLLRDAETALAALPLRGDGHAIIYDAARHGQLTDQEILARDLKWALQHEGLRLVYQPVVDMRNNALLGAEALIRWHHPVRGEVGAALLIDIAETFGLIRELGRWVIREAVPRIKSWTSRYPDFTVSINASPLELEYPDYADFFLDTLREQALPATGVALEITESTSLEASEITRQNLKTLNEAGIILCIDDFGVGNSSLNRLHAVIAGRLKIDRVFVEGITNDPGRRITIDMIIRLAEALKLDVVCEGVSCVEHVDFLLKYGLVKAQGYYHSAPVELEQMEQIVDNGYVLPG